jgi:acyl-CoA dehydrogenase
MMDFDLSPDLQRHQEAIRSWGREVAWPLARQADTEHHIPANALAVLDTCPVAIDRIDAGAKGLPTYPDGDLIRDIALWEAVTYGDAWLWESMSKGVGHLIVQKIGTPEQVERWYEPISRPGGGATGLGMSEPGTGSDTSGIATTAKRDGDNWVLNGAKMYCSRGAESEYIVVLASIDRAKRHAGIRAFVVEKNTPGLIITRPNESKLGLRCWVTTALSLENCVIPVGNQLGWTGKDDEDVAIKSLGRALSSFNYTRPLVALQACAFARAAFDYASELLQRERRNFAPHRWQKIEWELEHMDVAIERGRRFAYHAIWLDARGLPNRLEAAAAKAYGPPTAELIIRRCMQLLGPVGASEDHLLEKWYRDCKIFDIFEGTGQIMRRSISRILMGPAAAS